MLPSALVLFFVLVLFAPAPTYLSPDVSQDQIVARLDVGVSRTLCSGACDLFVLPPYEAFVFVACGFLLVDSKAPLRAGVFGASLLPRILHNMW